MLTLVVNPPRPSFDVRNSIERAFRAADLNIECAASVMGIPATQLSRQMVGKEHLSLQRLLLIEDARFWTALFGDIAAHFGLRTAVDDLREDVRAIRLALIPTRAVKAEMREPREKERAS